MKRSIASMLALLVFFGCDSIRFGPKPLSIRHDKSIMDPYWDALFIKYEPEEGTDYWKTPQETWDDNVGDCEDKAFLFQQLLKLKGRECRVVFGFAMSGLHAWTEVDWYGETYLIDPTFNKIIKKSDVTWEYLEIVPTKPIVDKIEDLEKRRSKSPFIN